MQFIVDQRENKLKSLLSHRNDVSLTNLEIGDIMFKRDDQIVLVIERKTIADLAASIRDGRNREQKARLLNCGIPRERIIYLIEGDLNKDVDSKIGSITYGALIGSIINTQLRDGITVYRTSSLIESVIYLEKLFDKIQKDEHTFWKYTEKKDITDAEYSSTLKSQKKANMTPSVWFIRQLSLIPQVTEKIGDVIVKEYKSINSLLCSYEKTSEKDRYIMLSKLSYPVSNGKTRKIGPKVSERIYKFIYGLE